MVSDNHSNHNHSNTAKKKKERKKSRKESKLGNLLGFLVVAYFVSTPPPIVMSFTMRRAAYNLVPRYYQRHLLHQNHGKTTSTSTLVSRWMSTQEPPVEKTEEEKAAIKAEREARKYVLSSPLFCTGTENS